ncbi:nucleoside hydrolase [Paenibacillus cremeus]|uniref:Nucleoside hydrolase n=1 Tax=Paenibacillus cremeus TaxID=2163881 RepID=A0A559JPU5_9BACL|nr:nucleoside hydrolase [Paenibacillus cremeus]TVY01878.1 nucleoside hydrolase [Paenibacillus cremeus]
MPTFKSLPVDELVRKLEHPGRKVRMVLDTDTFNEIDDQFAVVYALLSSERIELEAFYAAPFYNQMSSSPGDGMEKSYHELLKIRALMQREELPVLRGSTSYLPGSVEPVDSEAVQDLIRRAMDTDPSDPLYVVAIGAITNVASALLLAPEIIHRIVIVWLGGHAFHWPRTDEFNLKQDVHAARIIFDSTAPVVLIPCMGVASHLKTTLSEVREYVKDSGAIGSYLYETYASCRADHFGYSRVIWDLSVIAWLLQPEACPSYLTPSPLISDDLRFIHDPNRHPIRYVSYLDRDRVFQDLFRKLAGKKE